MSSPIRPAASDVVDDQTKRQIVAHNTTGEELCGWAP